MPIHSLSSGGIIANYQCPASCGHCLYGCSPKAEPGYITEATAEKLCKTLRRFGCYGVHIGGGEPFLNVDGLVGLIRTIKQSGVEIEYVETNAAWITGDEERDKATLTSVLDAGGSCVMVSADPFHVEFVPFLKPATLIQLLEKMRVSHFVWQQRYLPLLSQLDPHKCYNSEELAQEAGYDVIIKCAREYGMSFNGRALNMLRKMGQRKAVDDFQATGPCAELRNTGHFHVDFLGRYIPPGCTGLGILVEDLGVELDSERYPVLSKLLNSGVGSLLEYALLRGYISRPEGYVSKCDLCFSIRKYLAINIPDTYQELTPVSFYQQNF